MLPVYKHSASQHQSFDATPYQGEAECTETALSLGGVAPRMDLLVGGLGDWDKGAVWNIYEGLPINIHAFLLRNWLEAGGLADR